jgi:hypothetical protein
MGQDYQKNRTGWRQTGRMLCREVIFEPPETVQLSCSQEVAIGFGVVDRK